MHSRRAWGIWSLAVLVVAVAGILAIVGWPAFSHQVTLSTRRQTTPYTELYFSSPSALPKHLSTSHPSGFTFTIANHEGKAVDYGYLVTAGSGEVTSTVSQNVVHLGPETIGEVTISIPPFPEGTQAIITVSLVGRRETIHFAAVAP